MKLSKPCTLFFERVSRTPRAERVRGTGGELIKLGFATLGVMGVMGVIVLLIGCTSLSSIRKENLFERNSESYERLIRWSEFEAAASFASNEEAEKNPPDFKRLEHIKVTYYEVKETVMSEGRDEVRQVVDIQYYTSENAVLRTLRDRQLWEYDEKKNLWFVRSGLPDFE